MNRDDITGIVLCGGRGTRMGGVEKALQPLNGRRLVEHVIERLAPQVCTVVVSANRELDAYKTLGVQVIPDITPDLGPLGGLQAALTCVRTRWFFCCPGDAPYLDCRIVEYLSDEVDRTGSAMAFPHDGHQDQHLFLFGRSDIDDMLHAYLATGQRSVQEFVRSAHAHRVPRTDITNSFININSLPELRAAETRMKAGEK